MKAMKIIFSEYENFLVHHFCFLDRKITKTRTQANANTGCKS